MGLISLTLPNDGETIDAADVNSPLNTIATAINGNLDNANIKTGAAIDGSKIASASLTATQMADSVSPVKRWDEGLYDFVASGCVWTGDAYGSTLAASMTAGVVYINGKRVSVSAVTSRAFTASRDTYVDVDENGTLSYSEVANNAASPARADNAIRIAIVVSGASNILNQYSINQGKLSSNTNDIYKPNTGAVWQSPGSSTIVDGNGYRIYPDDPQNKLVSAFARAASAITGSPGGTSVGWNGMNYLIFQAEPNTNYMFTMTEPALSGMTNNDNMVFEIYLASAANTYTTIKGEQGVLRTSTINTGALVQIPFNSGSYSGKTFLNIKFRNVGFTGTCTMNSDATRTGIYTIEKL